MLAPAVARRGLVALMKAIPAAAAGRFDTVACPVLARQHTG